MKIKQDDVINVIGLTSRKVELQNTRNNETLIFNRDVNDIRLGDQLKCTKVYQIKMFGELLSDKVFFDFINLRNNIEVGL